VENEDEYDCEIDGHTWAECVECDECPEYCLDCGIDAESE
jgi:hypothetical protein